MKKFTQKELDAILREHELWVTNPSHGKRADLRWADLSGVDLSGVDLRCAELRGANLSRAELRGATLYRADLFEVKLSETNLLGANLSKADLRWADLSNTNLSRADLSEADLRWADLRRANLVDADLSKADISGANLSEASIRIHIACPEEGSFIGFEKAMDNYIVKLLIPDDARRNSATSRRCRCDKATVLSITNIDGTDADITEVPSNYDKSFIYRVGETVSVANFDNNRWEERAPGIHFFISRNDAVAY